MNEGFWIALSLVMATIALLIAWLAGAPEAFWMSFAGTAVVVVLAGVWGARR